MQHVGKTPFSNILSARGTAKQVTAFKRLCKKLGGPIGNGFPKGRGDGVGSQKDVEQGLEQWARGNGRLRVLRRL